MSEVSYFRCWKLDAPDQSVLTSSPNSAADAVRSGASKRVFRLKTAKTFAWRLTASYMWASFLVYFFGGEGLLNESTAYFRDCLIRGLNFIGFGPANPSHFTAVLAIGWLLLICGFSLTQVVGFVFYFLIFPVLATVLLLWSSAIATAQASSQTPSKADNEPALLSRAVVITGSILLGWFLLFGGSGNRAPLWFGVVVAGLVTSVLASRSLRRSLPFDDDASSPFWRLERLARSHNFDFRQVVH